MAYKKADEIAKLFAERQIDQSGQVEKSDLGTRETWSFWLTVKQAGWLSGQWFRENQGCNWNGRFGGKGQYGPDEAFFFWELRMYPNEAGVLTISRWLEDQSPEEPVDHPFYQYVTSRDHTWSEVTDVMNVDLMQRLMVEFAEEMNK